MQSHFELLFHPRSVAVVGVPSDPNKFGGNAWVRTMQELGFQGEVYPVDTKISEFNGIKVYSSIRDIPATTIDLVVVSVPAQFTPQIMEECVAKGAAFVELFTAGFSETGQEQDAQLEREVVGIAKKGGVRILGPNCMGIYCPGSGICWRRDFPRETGSVAVLSQSGGNAVEIVKQCSARGVRFSKLVSYGNASDLSETDFLDYFGTDPETTMIVCYIEGVKNGQGFLESLREASKTKPVVILKGGRTAAGTRAVLSHTASLAGAVEIWHSSLRQAGAINVHSLEELLDTVVAFSHMPIPQNRNVAVIGAGGGASVLAADECEHAGLVIPQLSPEIQQELIEFIPKAGTITQNPVDSPFGWALSVDHLRKTIEIVSASSQISSLILHFTMDTFLYFKGEKGLQEMSQATIEAATNCGKTIAVVLHSSGAPDVSNAVALEQEKYAKAGIPVYPTIARAAQAISKVLHYHHIK